MDAYKKMVVIFVDILGTKNNKLFEDKLKIHTLFHSEVKHNEQRNKEYVVYDRKVFSFSDCAYFFYYYKDNIDDNRKDDMKLIQIAMSNTSLSLLRILNAGYLIRGGISFGDAYFDDLGFFGPAVEEAYSLECNYADVPIIALPTDLGKKFYDWEENITDLSIVNMLMSSRPQLVEGDNDKYFINLFYQLESFMPSLKIENEILSINTIKMNLLNVIARDKEKYGNTARRNTAVKNKSSIYQKLDWFEKYLSTKHSHLKMDNIFGGYSGV